jgi:hypothetical protein
LSVFNIVDIEVLSLFESLIIGLDDIYVEDSSEILSEEPKLSLLFIVSELKSLEEIPEEHRETIRRLRAIGVGAKGRKLTAMEEYMAFVREYAREPIHYLNPDEDQKREHAIKQRWRVCKAKFTFEKYKGVLLEEIPEEDRQVVADLRQMWLEVDGAHVMEEYFSFIDTYKRWKIFP